MYRSRSSRAVFLAVTVVAALAIQTAFAAEGSDTVLRGTAAHEFGGSKSANYLAWFQGRPNNPSHIDVWVKPNGARAFKVNPRGTEAGLGSLDGNRLVYQQITRRDSNIRIMNLTTRRSRGVGRANTRHREYQPHLDGQWLLFARLNERTHRRTLILMNLRSGATRTLARMRESQFIQPGQINGDYAVWLQWNVSGLSKVKRYRISTRSTVTVPNNRRYNWASSVTPRGTVYFSRSGRRCGRFTGLFRWTPGSAPRQIVNFPDGVDMGWSNVYVNRQGKIEVLHGRGRCRGADTSDLWHYGDPFTVTLTVTKAGTRDGTVTGPGVACGTDCTQYFEPGSTVTLTATPEAGARFDGWSDPSCGTNTTCTITITADTTITASFRP
jgi:hypothetical protein